MLELQFSPDLIVPTETWFSEGNCGEIPVHCTRDLNHRGGDVSVFVNKMLKAKISVIDVASLPEIEYLHVKLSYLSGDIDIVSIYRPPNHSMLQGFSTKVDAILASIQIGQNVILAGDLNICGLSRDSNTLNFLDTVRSYGFVSHISIPTRPNVNGNDTQIDHIWSNFGINCRAGIFENVDISDHLINFVLFTVNIVRQKTKITFRDHSEECLQSMIGRLTVFRNLFPFLSANLDFNSKFDIFYNEIDRIYKISCPLKTKEIFENRMSKPWINRDLLLKIKRKHYLFKRYKNGAIQYNEYKRYESNIAKEIKKSKKTYLNKFNSCSENNKETWKLAYNILGYSKSHRSSSINIVHKGVLKTNDEEISNFFNKYFNNIGKNLSENVVNNDNTDPLVFMGNRLPQSFYFQNTNVTSPIVLLPKYQRHQYLIVSIRFKNNLNSKIKKLR